MVFFNRKVGTAKIASWCEEHLLVEKYNKNDENYKRFQWGLL